MRWRWKLFLLIVITGVVTKRAFQRDFIWVDHSLQHDLGAGWHLQIATNTFNQFCFRSSQQAGKLIFRQTVRHRRDRAQNGGRIGTDHHCQWERLTRMRFAPLLIIQRSSAMRQPAHNDFVGRDHLLAVNAKILARLVRAAG